MGFTGSGEVAGSGAVVSAAVFGQSDYRFNCQGTDDSGDVEDW